jgi:hypothetical protein
MARRRSTLKELGYGGSALVQGADIEVVERTVTEGSGVLVPNGLRINGEDVAVPAGASIQVHDLNDSEPVTVTLTVFARSISVRHESATE